ncbi:putative acetyltransferase [Parafrankia irregularis]|uniref:putative acetyltransferase n=1 Tax=Parafrankia irregularis TaxID=795642 RepID=UPI003BF8C8EC
MYVVHITPADIGSRVVIRRRIPGPLPLSDVLGTLESWSEGELRLRRTDGTTVSVPEESLVAARVVPPTPRRASPRSPGRAPSSYQPGSDRGHMIAESNSRITNVGPDADTPKDATDPRADSGDTEGQ